MALAKDAAHWQDRLDELVREHEAPGASLAIWADGQLTALATGVLNTATGVAVTTDSLFQIGSITKPYTASVLMRLVEQALVSAGTPVVEVLPEFRLPDPEATRRVTVRHLLTHTSGIDGDFFHDTGRGDDCIARYVEAVADQALNHPLDATVSYCNTGFVVLGRVIERLTGGTWDAAIAAHLAGPLGLTHTWTLPEDVLRFRAAMGHTSERVEDPVEPASQWGLMRSAGPAGLICATASDVVAFARMHLDQGRAPDGTQVLQPGSVAAMQEPQVRHPHPHGMCDHFGLAWMLFDWQDRRVYGHDGGTIGQSASLRIVPDAGVAVALLTNTDRSGALSRALFTEIFDDVCGVTVPPPLEPPVDPPRVDTSAFVGIYERLGERTEAVDVDGRLTLRVSHTGELADLFPAYDVPLVPLTDEVFLGRPPSATRWIAYYFYALPGGPAYLHDGGRATPKVS